MGRDTPPIGPRAYLESKPTTQSVKLGGRFVNLTALALDLNLDHGYLSRVMAGKRQPTLDYIKRIAAALHMDYLDLLDCIEDRQKEMVEKRLHQLGLTG